MKTGINCKISEDAFLAENTLIGNNVQISKGVIVHDNTCIEDNTIIGPYCIIGEPASDYYSKNQHVFKKTIIGADSIIRSHSVIYEGVTIGERFQTGHHVTIREESEIGTNCSIGTLSDIQHHVIMGDYVRIHSKVFIGELTRIEDFVWIYPSAVLTNDPYPPMGKLKGVYVKKYAQIFASSTILPGIIIGENALVGAHSVVTKDVEDEMLVIGSPAKVKCNIRDIKDENGNSVYPWKDFLTGYRGYPWQKENDRDIK